MAVFRRLSTIHLKIIAVDVDLGNTVLFRGTKVMSRELAGSGRGLIPYIKDPIRRIRQESSHSIVLAISSLGSCRSSGLLAGGCLLTCGEF